MKPLHLLLAGLLICCAAGLLGQTGREAYRQDYDAWRQSHPSLERDAGKGGVTMLPQVDGAASMAAAFGSKRAAYLKSGALSIAQQRKVLQAAATPLAPELAPPVLAERITGELRTVTKTIARFASDKDPGIQQLRLSLNRERDALVALDESIQAQQKAAASTAESVIAAEQARAKAAEAFDLQTSLLPEAVEQLEKENAAWAGYYEKLAQAIQAANAPPPAVSVVAPPAPRPEAVPGIPLAHYVGAWTYPTTNGSYHGAQPEFVDLVVHEQNGRIDGTLYSRFKLPPGSLVDPLIRFDFVGDLGATPTQRFPLVTSGDLKGTVELIPGPAFNLLEVNFKTDPSSNKITSGNFILVKK